MTGLCESSLLFYYCINFITFSCGLIVIHSYKSCSSCLLLHYSISEHQMDKQRKEQMTFSLTKPEMTCLILYPI